MPHATPWMHERTWPEIKAYLERDDVVVLPIGSTEQHGHHLPVMTDAAEAIAVALGAGERAGVLVAPPLWYGWTPHHMSYPGTVTLRAETLTALVEDICQSLFCHGFRHIVVINGHRIANLPPIEVGVVKVRNRTGGHVLLYDLALGVRTEMRQLTSGEPGSIGHACEDETSQMLHSYGHLVHMDRARRAVHEPQGRFHLGGFSSPDPALPDMNMAWSPPTAEEFARVSAPTGVAGDPTKASAEKGARILQAEVENVCDLIEWCRNVPIQMKSFSIPI